MSKLCIRGSFLYVALSLVAACAQEPAAGYETMTEAKAIEDTQARLLGQPRFNVSKVFVARLAIDGNDVTLTSLVPAFFRGYVPQERGFKVRDGHSFTLLAFNQERSGLELFTRDYKKKEAYHEVVPLPSIEAGVDISFPLVMSNGAVKQANVDFRELRTK